MQARSIFLTTAVVGLLSSGVARAEIFNEYETLPSTGATSFTIVLQGDLSSSLNFSAMQTDATVNPFYWVIVNLHGGVGTSTVSHSLNSQGNTVVTFTGPYPIPQGKTNSPGHPPHFGLDPSSSNGSGPKLTVVSQYWSNGTTQTQLPSITANAPALGAGPVKYEIFFANITQGGQTVGQWFEIPYTTPSPPPLAPTVNTGGHVTLSNVGFQLSPTQIPLDNLNFDDVPPPGQPGSKFTSLPQYDGPMNGVPEPSTWAMVLLGFAGAGLVAYCRKARAALMSA